MIKGPESTRISTSNCPSRQEALSIPSLTCLTEQEQSKLVTLPNVFTAKAALFLLQGFELDSLRSCRIALLFCLPVLELGLEWLDGFMKS